MLQINVRNHTSSTTIALRGMMDEVDGIALQDQLEFIVKFDNKLQLILDCTRLVSTSAVVWDSLYSVFLRLSYLREITVCGASESVRKAIERSRTGKFVRFHDDYQAMIDQLHSNAESAS